MKKYAYPTIPQGYDLYEVVDLARTPNLYRGMMICSLILLLVMGAVGIYLMPFSQILKENELSVICLCLIATGIALVVYIFLHEWAHGVFIRLFTGEPPRYGGDLKVGMFYASSHWFFGKLAYVVIALAPLLFWGAILFVMMGNLEGTNTLYWWALYLLQIANVTGSVGDIYITWRVLHMESSVIVHDEGMMMKFYAKTKFEEE